MGRKVHPTGFRIGIIRDWQAKWYASKRYVEFLHEDLKLRQAIRSEYANAGISLVEIDRQANRVVITIHTARPGVVIGRGGQRVDEMRQRLESLIGSRVQLNIQEIRQPELDAYLVAKAVAEQIERRIAHRRAMKQAIFRTLEAGAKGIRISCAGRLGGAEIARRETMHQGQVPLQKLRADIDYGLAEARTTLGRIGVKVWIYRGDILPQVEVEEGEEVPAVPAVPAEEVAEPVAEVEEVPAAPAEEVAEPVAEVEEVPAAPAEEIVEPVAEVEEVPAAPAEEVAEPVAEVEEVPAAPAEEIVEPVAEVEEVPAAPAGEVAEPVAEVEEVPAAPAEEVAEKTPEPEPVEPASVELKKKPAKPTRRAKKVKDKDSASVKSKEQDATTQTSEIPQDS
ncbi:MAG: 30S ribosomal protein S3 [Dehalococcoidia bacterium]|nr:MAG: 30S ribosomal protein S3 [Dehalococcoidia bacterium]